MRPLPALQQRCDDALHLHEARALDQHRRCTPARCPARRSAPRTSSKCRAARRRPAPHACTARRRATARRCRARAHRRRPRRGTPGRCAPTSPMSPSTSQRGPGSVGQQVDRGAHRVGVGVVAVVDQRDARPSQRDSLTCERPFTGAKASRPRAIASSGAAGGQRAGRRGQRVPHVVLAGDAQRHAARRRPACAASAPSGRRRHIGVGA